MEKTQGSKTYQILNEIFNAVTHGAGTGLAIAALVLLVIKGAASGSALEVVAFTIYGASLVILFLCSTLAHGLHFTKAVKVFRVFDHNGIFFLIAGTYTPYCLVALNNWLGWIVLAVIWICSILGIVLTSIYLPKWGNRFIRRSWLDDFNCHLSFMECPGSRRFLAFSRWWRCLFCWSTHLSL